MDDYDTFQDDDIAAYPWLCKVTGKRYQSRYALTKAGCLAIGPRVVDHAQCGRWPIEDELEWQRQEAPPNLERVEAPEAT